jgi:ABC-type antimicrobial peptide transport system permease subunit
MLLGQSLRPILVGLALGTLGGYGLSRALNAVFFRMASAEPLVFVVIAALMLSVALAAAWVPARRVTRIDPQQALRYE